MKTKSPFGFGITAVAIGALLLTGWFFVQKMPNPAEFETVEGTAETGNVVSYNGSIRYYELSVRTGPGEKDIVTLQYDPVIATQQQIEGVIGGFVVAQKDYYHAYTLTSNGTPIISLEATQANIAANNQKIRSAGYAAIVLGLGMCALGFFRGRATSVPSTAAVPA